MKIDATKFYINLIDRLFQQLATEFNIRRAYVSDEIKEVIQKDTKAYCILQVMDEVMKTVKELCLQDVEELIQQKRNEVQE